MTQYKSDIQNLLYRIAVENDSKAFSAFFNLYHVRLLRYANLFLNSIEESEDIVSDVLISMLKRREETFLKTNFTSYLFRAVKNRCLDHLKKESKNKVRVDINYHENDYFIFEAQTPLTLIIYNELTALLRDKIESLPPRRKMVFKLIKEEGMKYKEVSQLLDISERTVEVHLKLAIKELKEVLDYYMNISGELRSTGNLVKLLVLGLLSCFAL